MGIGEPLDNFEAVLKFINIIKEKHGINMSERSITLSTCGIIDKIKALADLRLKITLAISLHSPLQEERENLMPIAKNNPLGKLIEAIDYYILRTQRRVTIEYGLIEKVNDSLKHAQLLGKLLKGRLVHINVIPINPVENSKFSPSSSNRIYPFINILNNKYNIKTTVRRTLGKEIKASCGQLRNNYIKIISFIRRILMYKYEIIIYWSNEDNAFIAEVPELPGCMADGQTYEEVLKNVQTIIEEWIETAKTLNREIPQPKGKLLYA